MYRLIGRLESGGLAEIYRAERLGDAGSPAQGVVIKLLHQKTSDADYARSVAETARKLSPVTAVGIAHILEVGSVKGRLAIVREAYGQYTLGQVLRRLYTREVHLPPALALTFVIELLEVLAAVHAGTMVHGALTPGNVLVAEDGKPGLSEFGALDALQASPALRKVFAERGRSSYRAPELQGTGAATVASDVYAVGAMAYELLTLREASLGAGAVSTRNARLPVPSRLARRLNARLDPVVMRALEHAPSRRYRSCEDFAAGLRDFLANDGGVPSRSDLRKFVAELFPNEVAIDGLGAVPFDEPFSLGPLEGVQVRPEDLDSVDVAARNPFSGGEITERTETVDGLPALCAEAPTAAPAASEDEGLSRSQTVDLRRAGACPPPKQDDSSKALEAEGAPTAPITWEAPAAAVQAQAPAAAADPAEFKRRLRSVEDFAPGKAPTAAASAAQEPPVRRPAQTLVSFVTPFQRTDIPMPPSSEERRARAERNARVAAGGSTFVLMAFIILVAGYWYMTSRDMLGDLIVYLPVPIQREIYAHRQTNGPPGPPIGRPLKLPDFDALHPRRLQSRKKLAQQQGAAKEATPAIPTPAIVDVGSGCHPVASGVQAGALTVSAPRGVRVEIDGRKVCSSTERIGLIAGPHKVRASDPRTGQVLTFEPRIEAGKATKWVPLFKGR